jgi:hypothetical protein
MKSFNRVCSHLFGVSYIITLVYHNESNIGSYLIEPVIGIVKELCILHTDEAKTHKCKYWSIIINIFIMIN